MPTQIVETQFIRGAEAERAEQEHGYLVVTMPPHQAVLRRFGKIQDARQTAAQIAANSQLPLAIYKIDTMVTPVLAKAKGNDSARNGTRRPGATGSSVA